MYQGPRRGGKGGGKSKAFELRIWRGEDAGGHLPTRAVRGQCLRGSPASQCSPHPPSVLPHLCTSHLSLPVNALIAQAREQKVAIGEPAQQDPTPQSGWARGRMDIRERKVVGSGHRSRLEPSTVVGGSSGIAHLLGSISSWILQAK